jgi:hypothetical protein
MKGFVLSPQAFQDIDEIWEFIAKATLTPQTASETKSSKLSEISQRCQEWATFART